MRVLHTAAVLFALLFLPCGPVLAEMSQDSCRISADLEDGIALALRRYTKSVEDVSEPPLALKHSTRPELREQAQRVVAAREAYLASTRTYAQAIEDLSRQYRLCAR